ncbi:MAG TPA: NADH-quinone oxidoreductase subunit I [bacterium]|nr:NADH-quinone oxidoreductase subunit I [bacterium]
MGAIFQYFKNILVGFWNLILGLSVTTKYFLSMKTNTQQYPEEKLPLPARSRSMIKLIYDGDKDQFNCVACMMCAKACPNSCIKLEGVRDAGGKRRMTTFKLDFSTCIFCGYCVEACGFDALTFVSEEYENSVYKRGSLLQDEQAMKWVRPAHLAPKPEEPAKVETSAPAAAGA